MGRGRAGAVVFPLVLTGCAKIFGVDDWVYDPGDGSITNPGDGGGGGDALVVPGDGGDIADACAPTQPDDANGVFVTTTGTDSDACGARATPCKTITKGIARAKPSVYVGAGTYAESLTLRAGVTIEGGWTATWTRACNAMTEVVVRPTTGDKTVVADDIGGAASLVAITLQSKNADPGESIYGVFARGVSTQLTLNDVNVAISGGGAGAVGGARTQGGGSSLAIFAWDATVDMLGGSLRAGGGGAGGPGASGGGAGPTGQPSMGKPGPSCTVSCTAGCTVSTMGFGSAGMGSGNGGTG